MRTYVNIQDFSEEDYALLKSNVKTIAGGVLVSLSTDNKIPMQNLPDLQSWLSEQKAKLINNANLKRSKSLLSENQYVHLPNSTGVAGKGANYSTAIWYNIIQKYNNTTVNTLVLSKLLRGLYLLQHKKTRITADKIHKLVEYVNSSGLNSDFTDRFMTAIESLTLKGC